MATVAAKPQPRRRGGRRLLIAFGLLIVLIVAGVVWLNVAAQASVSASAALTVYQPAASTSRNATDFTPATTGTVLGAGDSVKTDERGRASITLPDGTVTQLAGNTQIRLDSAHFTRGGSMHDVSLTQQIGRTFTNVQHLVSGASFDVHGKTATASVRGTKFEIYIKADGTMIVKLFEGTLVLTSINGSTVTLHAGQQVTVSPDGTIGQPGPITPDPDDPFGPALDASTAVQAGTTPGTEQDYVGAPLHNGERQTFTYSYAGGNLVKASLGYPGSAMKLTVKAPDGQQYSATGKSPIVVVVNNAPSGIYSIYVDGVSGLGTNGEEPFVAVASVEDCKSADTEQLGAIHRGFTAQDLVTAVQQSGATGVSNLGLTISANTISGAVIGAQGTYSGFSWSGSAVMTARDGALQIMPTGGSIFGMSVPAQQVVDQIAAVIGQNPNNVNPGFIVDRLFTCNTVMMLDGRVTG